MEIGYGYRPMRVHEAVRVRGSIAGAVYLFPCILACTAMGNPNRVMKPAEFF